MVVAEARGRLQPDVEPGVTLHRLDAAEHHDRIGAARESQCLAAFGDSRRRDPAGPPDQGAVLVVPTPHERVGGRDGVASPTADEGTEYRIAVPVRRAHPGVVALRTDDRSTFAVCDERVVTQRPRLGRSCQHHRPLLVRRADHVLWLPTAGAGYAPVATPQQYLTKASDYLSAGNCCRAAEGVRVLDDAVGGPSDRYRPSACNASRRFRHPLPRTQEEGTSHETKHP